MKYDSEKCNICNCSNPIFKDGMCKEHYVFYMQEPTVRKLHERFESFGNGTAGFKSKLKLALQFVIHHAINYPMPFIEHFPLEHIYLGELYLLARKKSNTIDIERYRKIIADFDRPENENKAMMLRLLNSKEPEQTQIKDLQSYLFGKKNKPSVWFLVLALVGLILMYLCLKFGVEESFDFCGYTLAEVTVLYKKLFGFLLAAIVVVGIGLFIPSTYNSLIKRSYELTLFEKESDNLDVLNQVLYVKERNDKTSYYYSIVGHLSGLFLAGSIIYFINSSASWQSFFLWIGLFVMMSSFLLIHNTMVLFSPVMECMKRKDVKIMLLNPDKQGGLRVFHNFLFRSFIYNEGIIVCLSWLYASFNNFWMLVLCLLLFVRRANHAGWCVAIYIRSIHLFRKAKRYALEELSLSDSSETLIKSDFVKNISCFRAWPTIKKLTTVVLLPYLINQADDILKWLSENMWRINDLIRQVWL